MNTVTVKPLKILFVCTHNRCRSIISEAVANQNSQGLIDARSAGSEPAGEVHPLTLKYLEQEGFFTKGLQSQSWEDFSTFAPDLVITVCDNAAGEVCPLWMGNTVKMHWGMSDPSKATGGTKEQDKAFNTAIETVRSRISTLCDLISLGLTPEQIKNRLEP